MKRFNVLIILMVISILVTACNLVPQEKRSRDANYYERTESNYLKNIKVKYNDNRPFFSVKEFAAELGVPFSYDMVDKTLTMNIYGKQYFFIYGVPVVQVNGWYKASDYSIELLENTLCLPIEFLKEVGIDYKIIDQNVQFQTNKNNQHVSPITDVADNIVDVTQMTILMKQLRSPLVGAKVDTISSHLPGAKRPYRNGFHEGMDWYGYSSGVPINRNTKVFAMGEGVVVRADHDFKPYRSTQERNNDLAIAKKKGKTPEYILDRLRGRQVWVQYDNGLQARFAHLYRINDEIKVGNRVNATTTLGYIGNSGTSGEVANDDTELHLHLDILFRGELFWKNLSQEEIVHVLKTSFGGE